MKINIDEIEFKFKFLDDKKTKAIIALDFGDFVVRGFRVQDAKFENMIGEKLWFTPPSYMGGGRYHPMIFFHSKELWEQIEERMWKEYKIKMDEHYKKKFGIRPDELDT